MLKNGDKILDKMDELVKVINSYNKDLVDSKKPLLVEAKKLNRKLIEFEGGNNGVVYLPLHKHKL